MPDLLTTTVTIPRAVAADFVRDYTASGVLTEAAVLRGSQPRHNRRRLREALIAADATLPQTYEIAQAIKMLADCGFLVTPVTNAEALAEAIDATTDKNGDA